MSAFPKLRIRSTYRSLEGYHEDVREPYLLTHRTYGLTGRVLVHVTSRVYERLPFLSFSHEQPGVREFGVLRRVPRSNVFVFPNAGHVFAIMVRYTRRANGLLVIVHLSLPRHHVRRLPSVIDGTLLVRVVR